MIVVCINGSINSGKSTVARALAARLEKARFLEGDDHDGHHLPFDEMVSTAIERLAREIRRDAVHERLVMAYPLRDEDFAALDKAARERGATLLVVTLAPPLDVVLGQRGKRVLDAGETERIREMYAEGYHARPFSSLIVDGTPSVAEVVARIEEWLGAR